MRRLHRQLERLRGEGLGATLARGAGSAFAIGLAGFAMLYLVRFLLVKWIGRQEYGEYAFALSWATVLTMVAALGLPLAALRYVPQYLAAGETARLRSLLRFGQVVSLLGGAAVAGVGTAIVYSIDTRRYDPDTIALALWLVPLLSLAWFQRESLRAVKRIAASLGPSQVLQPVVIVVALGVVALVATHVSATDAVLATMAACAAVLVVQWVLLRKHLRLAQVAGPPAARSDLRGWFTVAMPLLLVQESTVLLGQADLLLVGLLTPEGRAPGLVAVYDAAAKTALAAVMLQRAVKTMATPMVAQLYFEGRHDEVRRVVATSTRWMFWSTLAAGVVVAALGPFVLRAWGKNFVEGAIPLAILVLGQIGAAACGPAGQLLNLLDHHRRSVVAYATSAALGIALAMVLIPAFGLIGAASATSVALVVRNVWSYALVRKHLGLGPFMFGRGGAGGFQLSTFQVSGAAAASRPSLETLKPET